MTVSEGEGAVIDIIGKGGCDNRIYDEGNGVA